MAKVCKLPRGMEMYREEIKKNAENYAEDGMLKATEAQIDQLEGMLDKVVEQVAPELGYNDFAQSAPDNALAAETWTAIESAKGDLVKAVQNVTNTQAGAGYAYLNNLLERAKQQGFAPTVKLDPGTDSAVAGKYERGTGQGLITFFRRGFTPKTVVHETMHALTVHQIERAEQLIADNKPGTWDAGDRKLVTTYENARSVMREAQAQATSAGFKPDHPATFNSVAEFMAEAWANRKLQKFLKDHGKIEISRPGAETATGSLWQGVVNVAKRLLAAMLYNTGANETARDAAVKQMSDTLLGQIMDLTPELLSTEQTAQKAYLDVKQVFDGVSPAAYATISDALVDLKNRGNQHVVLPLMELSALVRRFKDKLPSIGAYQTSVQKQLTQSKEYLDNLRNLMETHWDPLNTKGGAGKELALANLLNRSTVAKVWPNLAWDHPDNAHLHVDPEMTDAEALTNENHKEWAELNALWKANPELHDAYLATIKYANDLLKQEYALTTGAIREITFQSLEGVLRQEQLAGIRKLPYPVNATPKTFNLYVNQIRQLLKDTGGNAEATKLLNEMKNQIENKLTTLAELRGPYFPLMRFGDWVVAARSKELIAAEKEAADAREATEAFKRQHPLMRDFEDLRQQVAEARSAWRRKDTKQTRSEYEQVKEALVTFKKSPEFKALNKAFQVEKHSVAAANKLIRRLRADGKHYVMEKYDSKSKAVRREAALKAEGNFDNIFHKEADLWMQSENSVSMNFANKLVTKLSDKLQVQEASIGKAVRQLFIETQHDQSSLKHMLRRGNVAGFNRDARRVLQSFGMGASHKLAAIEFFAQTQAALDQVREDARKTDNAQSGADLTKVANELVRRHVMDMDYAETPVQDAVTGVTQAWILGASPAYLLQQLMQNFMLGVPYLASREVGGVAVGAQRAGTELLRATERARALIAKSFKGSPTKLHFELLLKDNALLTPREQTMLQHVADLGRLDILMDNEIYAGAKGQSKSKFKRFTDYVNWSARQLETANRIAAALATYNVTLAGDEKNNQAAMDAAAEAVEQIHVDYSNANAPRYAKRNAFTGSKLVMQFKKYQLHMIGMLVSNAKDGWLNKDIPLKERQEARRMTYGLLTTHALMGGTLGLPLAAPLLLIGSLFAGAGDDDDEFDPETEYKNFLAELLGKDAADVVGRGLPAAIGLDLHSKLGLGNIFSPMPFVKDVEKPQDQFKEYVFALTGPSVSLGSRFYAGLAEAADGDITRAAQHLAPKFVGDVVKSADFAERGITTLDGNVRINPADLTAAQLLMLGAGVPMVKVQKYYEKNAEMARQTGAATEVKLSIKKDYAAAKTPAEKRDAVERMREYNSRHPTDRLSLQDLTAFAKSRATYQKSVTDDGLRVSKKQQEYADNLDY